MSAGTVLQLKRELKRHKITQDQVAAKAGVTRTMVVHFLAGRYGSDRVRAAAESLLAGRALRRRSASEPRQKTAREDAGAGSRHANGSRQGRAPHPQSA